MDLISHEIPPHDREQRPGVNGPYSSLVIPRAARIDHCLAVKSMLDRPKPKGEATCRDLRVNSADHDNVMGPVHRKAVPV